MLEFLDVNVCNLSVFAIEDFGDLLKSRPFGLNVEEVYEDEFDEDPYLLQIRVNHRYISFRERTHRVDSVQLPGRLEVLEAKWVGILVDGQSSLDPEVHDHETLGTELEG